MPVSPTGCQHRVYRVVVDVYSRRIVGRRTATSMTTELPLDTLEMAIWARNDRLDDLLHYPDRSTQYKSIRYTERTH
jgi:putative transposase